MDQKSRRKQLVSEYKQTRPEAGVYRVVNSQTGKMLLASSPNLPSVHSKMEFARSTNAATIFGYKIAPEIRQYGIEAFALEILEADLVTALGGPVRSVGEKWTSLTGS